MKSYVITIIGNQKSEQAAARCIRSASRFGIPVEVFDAITPAEYPRAMMQSLGLSTALFDADTIYSRPENCIAAFLSHYNLWSISAKTDSNVLIFEHDAVVTLDIIVPLSFKGLLSYGRPSYGKFKDPRVIGVNRLQSKEYLPGAHAYLISPTAARIAMEKAKTHAAPTDIFFSNANFSFLEEYYPWPVEARDSFTTIQKARGCSAKHRWGPGYEII